jgi:predicted DNA-binding protein
VLAVIVIKTGRSIYSANRFFNLSAVSVPDEDYSRLSNLSAVSVPDEDYSRLSNLSAVSVPDDC